MLATVRKAWGWSGLNPAHVVTMNLFGNMIVRATDGSYWRICPEELSCQQVALNEAEFTTLRADEDFRTDWEMASLVELAREKHGPLPPGHCYCLKLPSVVGGTYEATNIATILLDELISFSGEVAEEIKDVPDGGQIQFKIIP